MFSDGDLPVPKFTPGRLVATPGVLEALTPIDIMSALRRHIMGDWGTLDPEDWEANEKALRTEGRLVSAYHTESKVKFYVITEWNRSLTTILLPSEY